MGIVQFFTGLRDKLFGKSTEPPAYNGEWPAPADGWDAAVDEGEFPGEAATIVTPSLFDSAEPPVEVFPVEPDDALQTEMALVLEAPAPPAEQASG